MSLDGTEVFLVDSVSSANKFLAWIKEKTQEQDGIISYDLETTGLNPRLPESKIRLAQLGDCRKGWAVPWERWSGVYMEALNMWEGPLVGHNTAFDNRWLMLHADWVPPYERIHDTMIMAQIVEPNLNASLKDLSNRYVDRRASVGDALLKQAFKERGWDWDTVPVDFPIYWNYGAIDPIITSHLFYHYRADLKFPKSYELEMASRRIVSQMEDNGIRIDLDYCVEQYDKLKKYVADSKEWAEAAWGVNINSSKQLVPFFQDRLGLQFTIFTKSGAPSTSKEQLEFFSETYGEDVANIVDFILGVKNADKKANTYFKNFLEMHHNSVLHSSFKTLHARTGRMSSTKPALQTIGKSDPVLRDAFVPHEGEVLLSCDYSQVELRLMAHYSGDVDLQEAFHIADATGGDFFVELGKKMYSDENFSKDDKRRNLIKTFMYAFLYGAGLEKMAKSAGVSLNEMNEFVATLHRTYPGVTDFQNKVIEQGDRRESEEGQGYVITPSGRRIPCDRGDSRVLVNYILQGTAAEVLKEALIRLDAAGLTKYMLLPIHDEVLFSVPQDLCGELSREISDIMSVRGKYAVDLIAEAEGPFDRWGDKGRG